jgi:type IV pilus assembly protein PilN
MITINLKPGVKRGKSGASLAGGLSALKTLPGMVKDPWPMLATGVWVAALAFLGWVGIGSAAKMHSVEAQLVKARAENHRFRALITERRRAEAAKDSVVTQIATIRAVDGDRYVWPHILDEVTRAMPAYTWLTDMSFVSMAGADTTSLPPPVSVQLNGKTMDIQGFTHFMRQLEDSPWLRDVTLISTGTDIDHGRAVTVFTVKAAYTRHGGA